VPRRSATLPIRGKPDPRPVISWTVPVAHITPEEACHLLADGDVDLVDVREPHEWAQGHIPGSRHVPLGQFLRDPQRHLRTARDPVVFVCAHGIRSLTAAAAAVHRGCEKALSLDGGIAAWYAAGFPVERSES
jgi:rhodanese-related sulfurtransferase